jgi:hypothetical protein
VESGNLSVENPTVCFSEQLGCGNRPFFPQAVWREIDAIDLIPGVFPNPHPLLMLTTVIYSLFLSKRERRKEICDEVYL